MNPGTGRPGSTPSAGPGEGPAGFRHVADFVEETEEAALLDEVRRLAFQDVRMRGQVARRRTAHLGWIYGYESWQISPGPAIPAFLHPLRARAAALAGAAPEALAEVLVTEYRPGAGIGWHRDAPMFGDVVGVSLLGACRFRFERGQGESRQTRSVALAPRSAYVLAGAARWAWRHSIPPGTATRYSITFRTLRPAGARGTARAGGDTDR